jgi:hypothetical protein
MGAASISHLECLRGYHAYCRSGLANCLLTPRRGGASRAGAKLKVESRKIIREKTAAIKRLHVWSLQLLTL